MGRVNGLTTHEGKEIVILAKHYDKNGKYLGMEAVYKETLTPEFIEALKNDKDNSMGWKKHKKVMKEKGYKI